MSKRVNPFVTQITLVLGARILVVTIQVSLAVIDGVAVLLAAPTATTAGNATVDAKAGNVGTSRFQNTTVPGARIVIVAVLGTGAVRDLSHGTRGKGQNGGKEGRCKAHLKEESWFGRL